MHPPFSSVYIYDVPSKTWFYRGSAAVRTQSVQRAHEVRRLPRATAPALTSKKGHEASFSRAIYYSCSSIPQPHAAEALTRWPSRPSGTDKASNPLSSPARFAVSSRDAMIWINPPALLHACAGMLHRIYFGLIILRQNLVLGWATYDCCNVYIWELPYFEVRCASARCHYPT